MKPIKATVSTVILDMLAEIGVDTVFTVPGAHTEDFLIQVCEDARFSLVVAAHEEGAGYMADGYARASGRAGVVVAINGPGATNLLTTAVTAYKDRSAVLFLTGDVMRALQGFGAFQAARFPGSDTHHMFQAAMGDSRYIDNGTALQAALETFVERVGQNVRLPLHMNVPIDLWGEAADGFTRPSDSEAPIRDDWSGLLPNQLDRRALILVGEELHTDDQYEWVGSFSEQYAIPVAVTMAAKNMASFVRPDLYLGVFGYAGGPRAFAALLNEQIETLLVFGATLGERNTVAWHPHFFHPTRTIICFSADPNSKRKSPGAVLHIEATVEEAVVGMRKRWPLSEHAHAQLHEQRQTWAREWQAIPRMSNEGNASLLGAAVSALNRLLPTDTQFFLDSGDHRIYGANYWEVNAPRTFFTSAKTAPMGWAIGAAIGASFVDRQRQICVLTGDGCMLMHGMELAVAARYQARVLVVVSNNRTYGRIANRLENTNQKSQFSQNIAALAPVDWTAWARSLGVPGARVENIDELPAAIERARTQKGPFLVELIVDPQQSPPFAESVFSATTQTFRESWMKRMEERE